MITLISQDLKPDISIFASAHRPRNWMDLYRSIGDNDVEFEMLFVGPNPPDYRLPGNFRFIRSLVKPTQCLEIAARNSKADLIINIADDCEFNTPQPLDKLYGFYKSLNSDKVIVSLRMMTDGEDHSHFAHRFFTDDDSRGLVMPVGGLISKKFYHELGGIDRNFIGIMWDLDMAMRVYALGGSVVLSDVYINEDRGRSTDGSLYNEYWERDRAFLESQWLADGKIKLDRKNNVEPFSDTNILNASQGPRGRWRGDRPIFIEKVEDGMTGFTTVLGKINRRMRRSMIK